MDSTRSLSRGVGDAGSITDVRGLEVGHFTDTRRPTGCTVILARAGAVAGVDVRGAAPGTRETELLSPLNAVEQVHAVLLAGGSAFGLDAAGGVMRWLDERGIGIEVAPASRETPAESGASVTQRSASIRVPIVPAAILFDLWVGDASIRPDAASGYAACQAASAQGCTEGNVGAGAGASVGKLFGIGRAMRGGLGSASITVDGITVAALVAVNAIGDVVDPASGRVIAGARSADGKTLLGTMSALMRGELPTALQGSPGSATTLGVVATDAMLTKAQANKVAQMAHDGFARSINPVHTMTDGDTIFALATGASGRSAHATLIGALGAEVMATAVLRAVRAATKLAAPGLPELPAAGDL
jgi:L-aminopeptidase/D-esterase-like protein